MPKRLPVGRPPNYLTAGPPAGAGDRHGGVGRAGGASACAGSRAACAAPGFRDFDEYDDESAFDPPDDTSCALSSRRNFTRVRISLDLGRRGHNQARIYTMVSRAHTSDTIIESYALRGPLIRIRNL